MTFDEWWKEMKPAEIDDLKPQFIDCWERAHAAGKLEAAEHILAIWRQPWSVTEKSFRQNLEEYVDELK